MLVVTSELRARDKTKQKHVKFGLKSNTDVSRSRRPALFVRDQMLDEFYAFLKVEGGSAFCPERDLNTRAADVVVFPACFLPDNLQSSN